MPVAAGVARQHVLEIAEKFRRPLFEKTARAPFGFRTLILVVEPAGDGVVAVVNLNQKIGDRQLQLVCPQAGRILARCQSVAGADEEQDIRGLRDDLLTCFEERRRKGRGLEPGSIELLEQWRYARTAGYIGVGDAGLLERQANEFPAALNVRPIIKLIGH